MTIDPNNPPVIRLPRGGRTMGDAVRFVRANLPGAKTVALEKFEIVVYFGPVPAKAEVSVEAAAVMAESLRAEHLKSIHSARDRENLLSLLTPMERKDLLDSERRNILAVGNIYKTTSGSNLVLAYQESNHLWSVTTVPVREVRPGVWHRFGEPTTHSTYVGHKAVVLARDASEINNESL